MIVIVIFAVVLFILLFSLSCRYCFLLSINRFFYNNIFMLYLPYMILIW